MEAMSAIEALNPRTRPRSRRLEAELDAAFAAARPRLVRIARSLVGSAGAEDVVHDTYVAARQSLDELRDPDRMEAWLARICVRRAFRVERRARRLRELLERLPTSGPGRPRATGLELRELIERLPPRERSVIVLHHGHGYTLLEVAELVGVSHANARKIAERARARLQRAWQEAEP
jgi:RNA polymerase sigma factor (sigma-70 family)